MSGKNRKSAGGWRTVAWSLAVVAGLGWVAWAFRWDPELSFELEKIVFYLETPVDLGGGVFDPPMINCSAKVRVTNSGSGTVVIPEFASGVHWFPPVETDTDCFPGPPVVLKSGEVATPAVFRHVPDGLNEIRFRLAVDAYRPSPLLDRICQWLLAEPLGSSVSTMLMGWLPAQQSRTFESPWYEAQVPAANTLPAPAVP